MELNKIYNEDCVLGIKKIPDKTIDMIITDPPYGIDYQSMRKSVKEKRFKKILNDKKPFLDFIKELPRVLKPTGCAMIFTRWDVQQSFIDELKSYGLNIKNVLIWDKVSHGMGDLQRSFGSRYESIIFVAGDNFTFQKGRPTDIIRVPRVSPEKLIHPNQKPVELLRYLIEQCCPRHGLVLDCFMGSGATAVACKDCDRDFIGFELDDMYYQKAERRIKEHMPSISLF